MRKPGKYLVISLTMVIIGAISLLFIPFSDVNGTNKQRILAYTTAAVFWCSFVLSQVFFWISNSKRKQQDPPDSAIDRAYGPRMGIIAFFSCTEAIIADLMLIVSFIAIILISILRLDLSWVLIVFVSTGYLSLNLHAILNGRNYKYIRHNIRHCKKNQKNL